MVICWNCSSEEYDDEIFCTKCGVDLGGKMLGKYEKAKYKFHMERLVITQPAGTKDGMWECELCWWENGGWAGYSSNDSFASIDDCIGWAKEQLAQKVNYNKSGKPVTKIMVEIYKPVEYKRITIA